jgi:hypothetical protein
MIIEELTIYLQHLQRTPAAEVGVSNYDRVRFIQQIEQTIHSVQELEAARTIARTVKDARTAGLET